MKTHKPVTGSPAPPKVIPPYKRRKDAGKIPLHTNIAVGLRDQEPNLNKPGCVALKLQSLSFYGTIKKIAGRQYRVTVLIGYYERHAHVEKWFVDTMDSEDELPAVLYRDPATLEAE